MGMTLLGQSSPVVVLILVDNGSYEEISTSAIGVYVVVLILVDNGSYLLWECYLLTTMVS